MGNLNWQATTPQKMRSMSTPTGATTTGGPRKGAVSESLAIKQPMERPNSSLAKAKNDLASGRITRKQFDAIVAKQSTTAGSGGGV